MAVCSLSYIRKRVSQRGHRKLICCISTNTRLQPYADVPFRGDTLLLHGWASAPALRTSESAEALTGPCPDRLDSQPSTFLLSPPAASLPVPSTILSASQEALGMCGRGFLRCLWTLRNNQAQEPHRSNSIYKDFPMPHPLVDSKPCSNIRLTPFRMLACRSLGPTELHFIKIHKCSGVSINFPEK